ncbi:MAG: hypothetical protein WBA05_01445 [Gordonia sp. (in: high G+C Gram-positive bacteria)]|uniref:hypothetical protein n=1 Tax=Gordonia sp. (in: high G+C Gram-positive bacteria) TaxID=84139 RepID=UPI003C7653EC
MEPVIEYYFGTGDGTLTHWRTAAGIDFDGDGVPDAVALDFDGDGRFDDLMWDADGDGVADFVLLDLDDDGVPEARYADSGRGLWDRPAAQPGGRAESVLDTDDDGVDDLVLIDADGDGYADSYRDIP